MIVALPLVRRFPAMHPTPDMAAAMRPNMMGVLPVTGGIAASALLVTILAPAPAALITPAAAFAEARKLGLTGNVFNSHNFGGYLIFAGEPTFIDGCTDQLFLGGFFSELEEASEATNDSAFSPCWIVMRSTGPCQTETLPVISKMSTLGGPPMLIRLQTCMCWTDEAGS